MLTHLLNIFYYRFTLPTFECILVCFLCTAFSFSLLLLTFISLIFSFPVICLSVVYKSLFNSESKQNINQLIMFSV